MPVNVNITGMEDPKDEKRKPQCGYCRFHPQFERTADGQIQVFFEEITDGDNRSKVERRRRPIWMKLQGEFHVLKCTESKR